MKKTKSKASLLPINVLPEIFFDLIKNRDKYIIKMRYEGHTLQEIGNSINLSRERIRQIIYMKSGPSTETVGRIRLAKYKREILIIVKKNPDFNRAELAREIEISQDVLKRFLGQEIKRIASNKNVDQRRRYSDSDLIEILRSAQLNSDGILTTANFIKNGGKPTIAIFISRFGSWESACNLAGVTPGKGRSSYTRTHSKLQLLDFVERYLGDTESNGSAKGYDQWQKKYSDAPSLALLRQRLGKWNDIKRELTKIIH